jgi:hypothetical protein
MILFHVADEIRKDLRKSKKGFYTLPIVGKGFEVGHKVRLKRALEPPVNIPAGAVGLVVRVSDWDSLGPLRQAVTFDFR